MQASACNLWQMRLAIPYPSAQAYDLQKKELRDPPSLLRVVLELQHRINAAKHYTSSVCRAAAKTRALSLGLHYPCAYPTTLRFSSNVVFSVLSRFKGAQSVQGLSGNLWSAETKSSEPEWETKSLKYPMDGKMCHWYEISVNQIFMLCAYGPKG